MAKVITLTDNKGETIYPRTKTTAVTDGSGMTLDDLFVPKTDITDMVRATSDSEHVLLGDGSVISIEDLMVKIGTRDVVTPVSYEEVK